MAIGANAVVFSVLNALILHPLHVPNADTLWAIQHGNEDSLYEAYPDYLDLRDRNRSFEGLADDSPAALPILGLSKEDACALHVGRTVANIATGVRFSTKPVELSNWPQSFPADSLRMLVPIFRRIGHGAHFSQILFEGLASLARQTANR